TPTGLEATSVASTRVALAWSLPVEGGDHASATRVEATLVASRPVGVEGGSGAVAGVGWKTAHTAYQSVAEERVAVPCWPPAALDVVSSSNVDPFAVCVRAVYG